MSNPLQWTWRTHCSEHDWPTAVNMTDLLQWRWLTYCSEDDWPTAVHMTDLLQWRCLTYVSEDDWPNAVKMTDLLQWRWLTYCSEDGWPTAVKMTDLLQWRWLTYCSEVLWRHPGDGLEVVAGRHEQRVVLRIPAQVHRIPASSLLLNKFLKNSFLQMQMKIRILNQWLKIRILRRGWNWSDLWLTWINLPPKQNIKFHYERVEFTPRAP